MRRVAAQLKTAGPRAEAKVAAATIKTLTDIETDGKALVAVDTGYLRSTISREITADTFSGRGGEFGGEVGPTAAYGEFVEDGTSRMSPQPYMRPAGDRRIPGFLLAVEKIGEQLLPDA